MLKDGNMKKLNQKGFSAVEVVIVVVVLGLIGGLGWYIKEHRTDKKTQSTTQTSSNSPTSAPQASKDPYEGWKTYSDDPNGITFKYPADWTAKSGGYGEAGKLMPYTINSPDMKSQTEPIGSEAVTAGTNISLVVEDRLGKTLDQRFEPGLQNWPDGKGPTKEARKIGDKPAYEYEYGYESQPARSIVFVSGKYYVTGSLSSQDISKNSRDYPTLVKILESVAIK